MNNSLAYSETRSARAHRADGVDLEADRRQVTVLFADVSGFTAMAERLDPEEVREFQKALFETMAQAILRYEGFVEKFVGDAVLAVFGAPVAHEDDPERSLEAALHMLDRCALLSERWATRLGRAVSLHIGIHTGEVVAGSMGNAAGSAYAVTGDTVNTTARLLAAASGTVLVSSSTYALTRHRFAFAPGHELTLRGKSEPITVYGLLGILDQPQSARGLSAHGLNAPLVGRAAEIEHLLGAFRRMQRARAQVVSLVGEAGAGKSRLIAEFLAHLESEGELEHTAVRRANCSSFGEAAYGVFGTLFREAYHVEPSDPLDVARQKLAQGLVVLGAPAEEAETVSPVLSYLLGVEEARPRDLEPEQLQRQIVFVARTLIERRLQRGPLLIIVEDLHWADTASVDLLRDVVDQLADQPLMLLFSHRTDTRPPLTGRAAESVIQLAPLSPGETRSLVGKLFGTVDGDAFAELQDFVASRAGGNPLFAEEIVRGLVNAGALIRQGDRWTCSLAGQIANIPPTLRGLLLSRVDKLPARARRLLQHAAVMGITFESELLFAVVADQDGSENTLELLIQSDFIRGVGAGSMQKTCSFTHALVRDAVYDNLLLARRTELHERVGRAIENSVGSHPERLSDLEALGHHWSLTTDKAKGARYLSAAGDWARAVYANEDAIRHYARALRTLADCDTCDEQKLVVRERLADLLALTGSGTEALEHYEITLREFEAASDCAGVARLQRKIGGLHWDGGDRERARACFALGIERLGEAGSAIERAQLLQEIGRLAFRSGDNQEAIAWAERALSEAATENGKESDDDGAREFAVTRAQACNTLGVALARIGRLGEAVEQIKRSIDISEKHNLLQAACRGYANLGVLYSSIDPRRSIETCLQGLETAKKVGDLGFQSRIYANLAVAYCALTDRCEAEGFEAAQRAIELDRRLGLLDHLAVPLIVLGQIHQCHGDHAEAFASYEEALNLAERIGEPQLLFPCYDGLATLYLDAGDQVRAEEYLAKSQAVCERAGVEPDALMVLPFLS